MTSLSVCKGSFSRGRLCDGCLFDSFPRTIPQAEAMVDAGIDIDQVIEIDVDQKRSRRVAAEYTQVAVAYHVEHNPPAVEGIDDVTGEALIQRDDDAEDTVRHRLGVYESQTRPLLISTPILRVLPITK